MFGTVFKTSYFSPKLTLKFTCPHSASLSQEKPLPTETPFPEDVQAVQENPVMRPHTDADVVTNSCRNVAATTLKKMMQIRPGVALKGLCLSSQCP